MIAVVMQKQISSQLKTVVMDIIFYLHNIPWHPPDVETTPPAIKAHVHTEGSALPPAFTKATSQEASLVNAIFLEPPVCFSNKYACSFW